MRRVWATVAAFWAMLAIVGVIAWSRPPSSPVPAATPNVLVVKGKNGKQQLVVVQPTAGTHATTQTSPPPPA